MHDYFTHVKCITESAAFMFIWIAYTQEEYRDRNIVDGCAFMFKGCDKLNELAHYYNIYKKSNQGTRSFSLWHVCVTEIYPYAMTSTCTLLLVIHVRYDSSTCDIKFLRSNYSPCMKQSSLLKFWKAGFIMKRLISIHWNTLRGVVDLINSNIHTRITLVCSVHS